MTPADLVSVLNVSRGNRFITRDIFSSRAKGGGEGGGGVSFNEREVVEQINC
jgi:hypothetical protein